MLHFCQETAVLGAVFGFVTVAECHL